MKYGKSVLVNALCDDDLWESGKIIVDERKVCPVTDKMTPAAQNAPTKGQSEVAPAAVAPIVPRPAVEPKPAPAVASVTKA